MDLDDQQAFTHGAKTMVECASIIRAEIQRHPFTESEAEEMLLIYWRAFVSNTFAPNFADIFSKMMPKDDD